MPLENVNASGSFTICYSCSHPKEQLTFNLTLAQRQIHRVNDQPFIITRNVSGTPCESVVCVSYPHGVVALCYMTMAHTSSDMNEICGIGRPRCMRNDLDQFRSGCWLMLFHIQLEMRVLCSCTDGLNSQSVEPRNMRWQHLTDHSLYMYRYSAIAIISPNMRCVSLMNSQQLQEA